MKCPPTHEAADAFWKYWRENGETHKHGYYESTWGAINAALRTSNVEPCYCKDCRGDLPAPCRFGNDQSKVQEFCRSCGGSRGQDGEIQHHPTRCFMSADSAVAPPTVSAHHD